MAVVRRVASGDLRGDEMASLRALFHASWQDEDDEFTDEDWDHAFGGLHFVLEEGGAVVSHAAVIERRLHTSGHDLATGYVEAVATSPEYRGRGWGSAVMKEVGEYIDRTFQLGALDSGRQSFYERLGWIVWKGPTFVHTDSGLVPTPEEDGYVLVRLTPTSPDLDPSAPISCDWRPGDVW
ncbi:MAG TPA: GNAT family N-acetyltransferase [Actinomycetota bacterium]|nr:GNAT family N-acetyltransferase [Actinomycetota bacterium]